MKKSKVLVALSGGVDSSMAAIILKEKGYDLVGITLKVYDNKDERNNPLEKAIADAKTLANKIKIPHYGIDVKHDFGE